MGNIRYVAVSDLHLGAGYSLLTAIDGDGTARPGETPDVVRHLADGLRHTLGPLSGSERPTLVLLGDVFELSFSPTQHTMQAFARLIDALWHPEPIFSDRIIYVPGNHDHQEWRTMRDAMYLAQVQSSGIDSSDDDPTVTALDQTVTCELATAVARGVTGNAALVVETGYPNIGMRHGDRCVVMHHGHYVESTYLLMNKVAVLLGGAIEPDDVETIERLNGPWIDFGWSNTGDQGELGAGIMHFYEVMLDPAASHDAMKSLTARLLGAVGKVAPVTGATTIDISGYRVTVRGLVEGLLDLTLDRIAQSERTSDTDVMTRDGLAGVGRYLSGPVRLQLESAGWADGLIVPADRDLVGLMRHQDEGTHRLDFVFGHTHKPFQDLMLAERYARPVGLWNTGGWVLDHPGLSQTQGAAAVMVDDELNVASLRLFNDPLDGDVGRVRALGDGSPDDARNPLLHALADAVDPDVWSPFSAACLAGTEQRARLVRSKFFDPAEHPPTSRGRRAS